MTSIPSLNVSKNAHQNAAHAHAEHQWLGCGAAFLLHRDARPAPIWHGTSRSFPDYFPQTERIKIAATYLELVPSRFAAVRHHLEMPESGRFIHKMLSVTVMHVGQSLEASRQTFSDFALALEAVRRGARRNASRPAHGHQMH